MGGGGPHGEPCAPHAQAVQAGAHATVRRLTVRRGAAVQRALPVPRQARAAERVAAAADPQRADKRLLGMHAPLQGNFADSGPANRGEKVKKVWCQFLRANSQYVVNATYIIFITNHFVCLYVSYIFNVYVAYSTTVAVATSRKFQFCFLLNQFILEVLGKVG